MTTQTKIEDEIRRRIEKGELGEIDYHWNGRKVIKDRISFGRQEFFNIITEAKLLGITEGKKLMIDEVLKIIEDLENRSLANGERYLKIKQKLNQLKEQDD